MISALVLSLALASTDPKVDREAPPGCVLVESFTQDIRNSGFIVVQAERDIALRYIVALVTIGYPAPPVDPQTLSFMLIVTNPKTPEKVMIALVDDTGVICAAAVVPRTLHDSIFRGA